MGIEKKHFVKRSAFSLNTFRINEIVNKTLIDNLCEAGTTEMYGTPLFPEEELSLAYVFII